MTLMSGGVVSVLLADPHTGGQIVSGLVGHAKPVLEQTSRVVSLGMRRLVEVGELLTHIVGGSHVFKQPGSESHAVKSDAFGHQGSQVFKRERLDVVTYSIIGLDGPERSRRATTISWRFWGTPPRSSR